jgi:hypothetical protein
VIRALHKTRRQYSQVLSESEFNLNMSRYFRLMALAATEVFFAFPVDLFGTISHFCMTPLKPWISWADTHQYTGQVMLISNEVFDAQGNSKDLFNLGRWDILGGAFLFFMFFGLSSEARQDYKRIFWRIAMLLGIKPPALNRQSTIWYVCFAFLQGCTQPLTISLGESPTGPGGTTSSTECATSDDSYPSTSTDNKNDSLRIKQDTIELKGYDLESQHQ